MGADAAAGCWLACRAATCMLCCDVPPAMGCDHSTSLHALQVDDLEGSGTAQNLAQLGIAVLTEAGIRPGHDPAHLLVMLVCDNTNVNSGRFHGLAAEVRRQPEKATAAGSVGALQRSEHQRLGSQHQRRWHSRHAALHRLPCLQMNRALHGNPPQEQLRGKPPLQRQACVMHAVSIGERQFVQKLGGSVGGAWRGGSASVEWLLTALHEILIGKPQHPWASVRALLCKQLQLSSLPQAGMPVSTRWNTQLEAAQTAICESTPARQLSQPDKRAHVALQLPACSWTGLDCCSHGLQACWTLCRSGWPAWRTPGQCRLQVLRCHACARCWVPLTWLVHDAFHAACHLAGR